MIETIDHNQTSSSNIYSRKVGLPSTIRTCDLRLRRIRWC